MLTPHSHNAPIGTAYRPDVDGLRALAVFAVLAYHAFPSLISGGFVGVDIFFVISGFVITRLIADDIEAKEFSYLDFYARRVRRIFPALIAVLLFCLLVGTVLLFADEQKSLIKHITAAAGFYSNIQLWRETGYFDTMAELKPLLHLWTLGVEMQFYVLWPIALLLFRRRMLMATCLMLALSFFYGLSETYREPSSAFYLPFSRFWELLMGGIVAFMTLPERQHNSAAWIGIALIVFSLFSIGPHSSFPGWNALLPVVGTALLIGAPTAKVNKVLSHKWLVFVGLISFPLYLWHWPLIVAVRYAEEALFVDHLVLARIIAVLLAFVFAYTTYRFIETPIRRQPARVSALCLLLAMAALACGAAAMRGHVVMETPAVTAAADWVDFADVAAPIAYKERTYYAVGDGPNKVLFMGDSNAEQYFPRVAKLANNKKNKTTAIFATLGGCAPIPAVQSRQVPNCLGFTADVINFAAADPEIKRVVIAASWPGYFASRAPYRYTIDGLPLQTEATRERAYAALGNVLRELVRQGKRVTLVLSIPSGMQYDPKIRARHDWLTLGDTPIPPAPDDSNVDDRLMELAKQYNVSVIDPRDSLCKGVVCPSLTANGDYMYKDATHLRGSWVRENATFIDPVITGKDAK